jgi:hypothetical protein
MGHADNCSGAIILFAPGMLCSRANIQLQHCHGDGSLRLILIARGRRATVAISTFLSPRRFAA